MYDITEEPEAQLQYTKHEIKKERPSPLSQKIVHSLFEEHQLLFSPIVLYNEAAVCTWCVSQAQPIHLFILTKSRDYRESE